MAASRRSGPLWLCPHPSGPHPYDPGTSIMRSSYLPPPSASSRPPPVPNNLLQKDRSPVQGAFPQNQGPERLLPGTGRTHLMGCSTPHTFLPRKRRVGEGEVAASGDHGVLQFNYTGSVRPEEDWTKSRDVSSVNGMPYTRRKHLPGPDNHLVVTEFDGGVQGEPQLFHPTRDRH